jgi:hypothetical protein
MVFPNRNSLFFCSFQATWIMTLQRPKSGLKRLVWNSHSVTKLKSSKQQIPLVWKWNYNYFLFCKLTSLSLPCLGEVGQLSRILNIVPLNREFKWWKAEKLNTHAQSGFNVWSQNMSWLLNVIYNWFRTPIWSHSFQIVGTGKCPPQDIIWILHSSSLFHCMQKAIHNFRDWCCHLVKI